jgi:protein-S-isoprenylcysteine O-methyltransferase Ste14
MPMSASRKGPGTGVRKSWLGTVAAALVGAVLGAELVSHPRAGLLSRMLGPWLARHGLASAQQVRSYEAIVQSNIDRLIPGLLIYMLFSLYWVIASKNRATDAAPESLRSSSIHKVLVNLSLLAICLPLPGLTFRLLPQSPAMFVIGIVLELGGAGLAIAARRALGTNWSREVRIAVGHELVQSGPYARIRHPIYTGALSISLGLAIQSGLLSALVGLGILILAYIRKIALEERLLSNAFGAQFDQYCAKSWALIPFLI